MLARFGTGSTRHHTVYIFDHKTEFSRAQLALLVVAVGRSRDQMMRPRTKKMAEVRAFSVVSPFSLSL